MPSCVCIQYSLRKGLAEKEGEEAERGSVVLGAHNPQEKVRRIVRDYYASTIKRLGRDQVELSLIQNKAVERDNKGSTSRRRVLKGLVDERRGTARRKM